MNTSLLSLKDGDILNFSEDHESQAGCDTCDFGSSYIQDFTVDTTQNAWEFKFDNMYDYAVSHEFLLQSILPNVTKIQSMTINEFITWLTEKFKEKDPTVQIKVIR